MGIADNIGKYYEKSLLKTWSALVKNCAMCNVYQVNHTDLDDLGHPFFETKLQYIEWKFDNLPK